MIEIKCEDCKVDIQVPKDYHEPFYKCPDCGSLQSLEKYMAAGPKYKILNAAKDKKAAKARERAQDDSLSESEMSQKDDSTQPALATVEAKEKNSGSRLSEKTSQVVSDAQYFLDVLGKEDMDYAFTLVCDYYLCKDEQSRSQARGRAIQKLMKSKVSSDVAVRAISYIEKSDKLLELLEYRCKKMLMLASAAFVLLVVGCLFAFLITQLFVVNFIIRFFTLLSLFYVGYACLLFLSVSRVFLRSKIVYAVYFGLCVLTSLIYFASIFGS